MDDVQLDRILESLIFASRQPVPVRVLARSSKARAAQVREALGRLVERYADRGIRLEEVAGGWQFRTPPETAEPVKRMLKVKPIRLSRAAMETLAVIAYRQPCTRVQVDQIRGVESGGVVKFLMDRGFIKIIGKKEEPGRPFLYATTQFFLEFFGLGKLDELPPLSEALDLGEDEIPEGLFDEEQDDQQELSLQDELSDFIGEERRADDAQETDPAEAPDDAGVDPDTGEDTDDDDGDDADASADDAGVDPDTGEDTDDED